MRSKSNIDEAKRHLREIGATLRTLDGAVTELSFDECTLGTVQRESLPQLSNFPSLTDICFYGTPVDGEILSRLTCQLTLRSLNLNCTAVQNRDIVPVQYFSNLEFLGLMDTAVTDDAIDLIIRCSKLNNMRIDGAAISGVGAARLAHGLELTQFWISGSQISGASVAAICDLQDVHELHIVGSDLTDSSLNLLEPLAGANYVYFSRCSRLTRKGRKRLQDLFPHLRWPHNGTCRAGRI